MIATPTTKTKIIDAGSGVVYIAKANSGVGNRSDLPVWQIKKIVTSAGVTDITWAEGGQAFDKIADNYASYTYS